MGMENNLERSQEIYLSIILNETSIDSFHGQVALQNIDRILFYEKIVGAEFVFRFHSLLVNFNKENS